MEMAPTPALALTEQEEQDMLVAQRAQEEEEAAAREDTEQVIRREQSDAELARKTLESLDKDRKQQKASDAAMAHNDVVLEFHTELQSAPAFPAPPPPLYPKEGLGLSHCSALFAACFYRLGGFSGQVRFDSCLCPLVP